MKSNNNIKVALVHDYLSEYGGAERVLMSLCKIFPNSTIFTAFKVKTSSADKAFRGKKIVESWFGKVPFLSKLYSPLRFLIPWIWSSFDLSSYDLVITSASWYITKGLGKKHGVYEICYCHTPPRWLYGYTTSINWQKWWIVRVYALIVGHFLRMYDYVQAQKVDLFVANSLNVARRIEKFYRRESLVVYPPVEMGKVGNKVKEDFYLMITRVVGGKGIEMAIDASRKYGFRLVIAGENAGFAKIDMTGVEYLGPVDEAKKFELMAKAKAFLALEKDVDFGISVVEAMSCGTGVIAFNAGGYRESIRNGVDGVLFDDYSTKGLKDAMDRFDKLKIDSTKTYDRALEFSTEKFESTMIKLATKHARITRN